MSLSSLTVAKFGGTSVADHQAMLRCAHIIKNDPSNKLVVVSASSGVTNSLVRLSQKNVSENEHPILKGSFSEKSKFSVWCIILGRYDIVLYMSHIILII